MITATRFYDPTAELESIGIDRPAGVDTALEGLHEVQRIATAELPRIEPTLGASAVATAVRDATLAQLDREYARVLIIDFERAATDRITEAYRAAAPKLLAKLKDRPAEELAAITAAAEHMRPGDTADDVLSRGGAAVDTWQQRAVLQGHAYVVETVLTVMRSLATLAGATVEDTPAWLVPTASPHDLARARDIWDQYRGLDRLLALVQAGFNLAVATPKDVAARLVEVARTEQAEHTEAAAAEAAEHAQQVDPYLRAWDRTVAGKAS